MAAGLPSVGLIGPALRRRFASLTFRVVAFSTIWAVVALIVIATVISALFRQASERGFESLLHAHLFNLISSVGAAADGTLNGAPDLGDIRFTVADSGWYWSVEPASSELRGSLSSLSLTGPIASPPVSLIPFNADFQRAYRTDGLAGETLQVVESDFALDAQNRIARFRVMGNLTELESDIAGFDRQIYLYLALFGAGMIAINAIAILLGLHPLTRVRHSLAEIRAGRSTRLDGRFPAEIAPLADETNALIDGNRRIMERSRTQVGNLAHSLKTPLAVLTNEARAIGGSRGTLISEQAEAMRQQIEHYLQRARIAAQRDSVVFRTPVAPVLERLVRVMTKLNPQMTIEFVPPAETIVFAGEREDLEEIVGNLLENAMKWGRERVVVRLSGDGGSDGEGRRFRLAIEDDGPGIPEDKARDALQRGRRLDETKPGTGLGLAIVADLVREYGGDLRLERSELGGLRVAMLLRRAQD